MRSVAAQRIVQSRQHRREEEQKVGIDSQLVQAAVHLRPDHPARKGVCLTIDHAGASRLFYLHAAYHHAWARPVCIVVYRVKVVVFIDVSIRRSSGLISSVPFVPQITSCLRMKRRAPPRRSLRQIRRSDNGEAPC